MTILTQGDSSGTTRRCDGTCHHARTPRCTCLCGGRYHGAGRHAQERLTRDWLGDDWREQKARVEAAGGSFEAVVVQVVQARLKRIQRPQTQRSLW